jgi:adenylate kinase
VKVLFAGLPGSGKTTQAKIIANELKVPLASTGNILREIAKDTSPRSKKIKEVLLSGLLVDDEIIKNLIKKRLSKKDCQNGFIVDGYPRSLEQLNLFDPQYDKVIYLRISEKLVEERLLSRGRADDKEAVIEERFDVYHHETEPLIEHFKTEGILVTVDATGSIAEVSDKIKKILKDGQDKK